MSVLAWRCKENHKNCQDSWSSGPESNSGLPEYEAGVLITLLWHFVLCLSCQDVTKS